MKKFVSESWLVLSLGVIFALLLAGAQVTMKPTIEANQRAELVRAIETVVPGTDHFIEFVVTIEKEIEVGGKKTTKVKTYDAYKCLDKSDQVIGWAVKGVGPGFIDRIQLVAGFSADRNEVQAIEVIQHSETPGLGTKIDSKENPEDKDGYPEQYAGKSTLTPLEVIKGMPKADQEIAAITGATYSSNYVCDIVNELSKDVVPVLESQCPTEGDEAK